MIRSAIAALACFASLAVYAKNKTPDIAAKVADSFKLGELSPVYFYSTADNYLNAAAMCVGVNCQPADSSLGYNEAVKPENGKYRNVSKSNRSYSLDKSSLVTLLYTVERKSTVYLRIFELVPAAAAVSSSGFELKLKEEAVIGEMSVAPAQPTYAPQRMYQPMAGSLQAIAQARANAMAANNQGVYGQQPSHAIGGAPPVPGNVSEGIGYGQGWAPTCVLPGRVVADASAIGATGLTYRVRFFQ